MAILLDPKLDPNPLDLIHMVGQDIQTQQSVVVNSEGTIVVGHKRSGGPGMVRDLLGLGVSDSIEARRLGLLANPITKAQAFFKSFYQSSDEGIGGLQRPQLPCQLVHDQEIMPSEHSKKTGRSKNTLFDCCRADSLAVNRMPRAQMDSTHGQLPLPPDLEVLPIPFEQEVVVPLHMVTEMEVVEPAGRNCPKADGRTQGTGLCLENSRDIRSYNLDLAGNSPRTRDKDASETTVGSEWKMTVSNHCERYHRLQD